MNEERTSKVFRNRFRASNGDNAGIIGRTIDIHSTEEKPNKEDENVRTEIQMNIKNLVKQGENLEKIKESLYSNEKYKKYEEHFDLWIENWVLSINPTLKRIIKNPNSKVIDEEIIKEKVRSKDEKLYELYKDVIDNTIRDVVNSRKEELENKEKDEQEEER